MLVLMRRRGQSIVAGEVRFTILGIVGENVRVGIEAPREVTVDRLEVHERKLLESRVNDPHLPIGP